MPCHGRAGANGALTKTNAFTRITRAEGHASATRQGIRALPVPWGRGAAHPLLPTREKGAQVSAISRAAARPVLSAPW